MARLLYDHVIMVIVIVVVAAMFDGSVMRCLLDVIDGKIPCCNRTKDIWKGGLVVG